MILANIFIVLLIYIVVSINGDETTTPLINARHPVIPGRDTPPPKGAAKRSIVSGNEESKRYYREATNRRETTTAEINARLNTGWNPVPPLGAYKDSEMDKRSIVSGIDENGRYNRESINADEIAADPPIDPRIIPGRDISSLLDTDEHSVDQLGAGENLDLAKRAVWPYYGNSQFESPQKKPTLVFQVLELLREFFQKPIKEFLEPIIDRIEEVVRKVRNLFVLPKLTSDADGFNLQITTKSTILKNRKYIPGPLLALVACVLINLLKFIEDVSFNILNSYYHHPNDNKSTVLEYPKTAPCPILTLISFFSNFFLWIGAVLSGSYDEYYLE